MRVKLASCALSEIAAIISIRGDTMATTKKTTAKKATAKSVTKKTVAKKAAAPKAPAPKAATQATKAKSTKQPKISVQEKQQMVAAHAYFKWEQAGRPLGHEHQHWVEAEAEVDAMLK
jgi:type II secretory pathway component HofQ